eukprot:m.73981 g.73981  ORF g.73981 m.73981 type:complete len:57 (+) comp11788_c2_seq3:2228-2398(+)
MTAAMLKIQQRHMKLETIREPTQPLSKCSSSKDIDNTPMCKQAPSVYYNNNKHCVQ